MTMSVVLFALVAALTAGSALGVVLSRSVVRAAVWLLFTLIGVSLLYFLLGADFVGATQLIVYVGGTLVLVVFGVMLTAQGPFVTLKTGAAEWALAVVTGCMFLGVLVTVTAGTKSQPLPESPPLGPSVTRLGQSFVGLTDAMPEARLTGISNPPP